MSGQGVETVARVRGGPLSAAWRVVWASRVHKLFPLLILMTSAGLLVGPRLSPGFYALAVVVVMVGSMLGMQLNVLTDRDLDRSTKPQLLAGLTNDPRMLRAIMWAEGLLCALALVACARGSVALALALFAYWLCFTLYSYNIFLPRRAASTRLKVFWWGNLSTVLGGYAALWLAGFALAGLPAGRWWLWGGVAVAVSLVDYGVFLNECAGDAPAERAHGLRTLPALLGERGASALAVAFLTLGAAVLALLVVTSWQRLAAAQVAMLFWHAAVQAASVVMTLLVIRRGRRRWETLVDLSFWISRVGALAIALGWRLLTG
jgi:4-hydroxybenzoate polyprenyltransferase